MQEPDKASSEPDSPAGVALAQEESRKQEAKRFHALVEILAALPLFAVALALGYAANELLQKGRTFDALEAMGWALGFLGGCFDPVNAFWFWLPFNITYKEVAAPTRLKWLCVPVIGAGVITFLVGFAGNHWPK